MFRTNRRGRGTPVSVKLTTLALALILLGISIHPVFAEDGKLPFHTGAVVVLVSPWLDYACDTATDPAPYGPYGPGGDYSYSPKGDHDGHSGSSWAQRRALRDITSDGSMGRKVSLGGNGKGKSYPYGPGDDDDLAKGVVWCNVTVTDDPPQPYLSEVRSKDEASDGNGNGGFMSSWLDPILSALANAGAAAFSRTTAKHMDDVRQLGGSGGGAVKGSQWDLDGFVLMGADFRTPYVFSGGRVFLKNQNKRKFCRLADDNDDDDGDFGLPSATLVCDEMTSSAKTEFVVEMVDEVEEDEEVGRSHRMDSAAALRDAKLEGYGPSGGDGDWPSGRDGGKGDRPDGGGADSGDDSWPGRGGKDGKKTSVMIRLRAPQNDMRYCGPDRRIRGSPLICDMRHPDTSHRRLTDFKLVDATPTRSPSASP
ncbi:hypothetical protein Vafri_12581 [Volvox africanus]|uniref:Uncharacterized protein n=1 Tax=Volvox africanus TaxID=51714 RepID=A0A8J4BAB3_9CHLO|nr:hypothetical protein Vafri_12581 [Volvox africanus]